MRPSPNLHKPLLQNSQEQQLIQRLQAIEEDLEEVKVVIQQTSTSLKTEVSTIMRNECNMLKEEIINLFCQTMDKVEDRFSIRMVHNYRLVEDRMATVERHVLEHGSEIKRVAVQMKVQLSGWNVLPTIE
ncbi:hypothetical protein Sjap_004281 [Stephania japonica]|uniref:Uncharacterized protein n=1 Tax=Stephania japonica TaxID=461633 RepID=A0AAP0K3H6_9MAGN